MRTSSTEPARTSSRRLLATIGIAVLALGGAAAAQVDSTGALYTAEANATLTGFQVQSLCDWDGYQSVQNLLEGADPALHWSFDPDEESPPWTAVGGPLPVASVPDEPLACDEQVLALGPGQAAVAPTGSDLPSVATVLLVLDSPSTDGVIASFHGTGGTGVDVVSDGGDVAVRAWHPDPEDGTAPVITPVATAPFGGEPSHLVAVSFDGTDVTLQVDDATQTGMAPGGIMGLLGDDGLGLGALSGVPEDIAIPTATFTAAEFAVVPAGAGDAAVAPLIAALLAAMGH